MASRATTEGQILVELDEDELRFDPSEIQIHERTTAGAPRVSSEDRIFFIKALQRLATAGQDPQDPKGRLRKLRRELEAQSGTPVGEVAPAFRDQATELRRLTREAGDLGGGILVEAPMQVEGPADVGYLETGEMPHDTGPSRPSPSPSHGPDEALDPWAGRAPTPGPPRPGTPPPGTSGPGGGTSGSPRPAGERRDTPGGEPSEGEQGPSIDIGTIAWVLLILAFILLQLIGGEQ